MHARVRMHAHTQHTLQYSIPFHARPPSELSQSHTEPTVILQSLCFKVSAQMHNCQIKQSIRSLTAAPSYEWMVICELACQDRCGICQRSVG